MARAKEELRDFEDRKPSPYPKLLMWTPTHGQNAKITDFASHRTEVLRETLSVDPAT